MGDRHVTEEEFSGAVSERSDESPAAPEHPSPLPDQRPRAYREDFYPWNLRHVPPTLTVGKDVIDPHPGRSSAIYVVHGIGEQAWRHAMVFFKHEDAGAGPRMAAGFLELGSG